MIVTIYKCLWFVTEEKDKFGYRKETPERCKFVFADVLIMVMVYITRAMFFILKWIKTPKHYRLESRCRFSDFFYTREMLYIDWYGIVHLLAFCWFSQITCFSLIPWRSICWNESTVLMISFIAIFGLLAHVGLKLGYALKRILDIEFQLKVFSVSFSGASLRNL